jgi:pyruvate dehydrogenase E1 component
VLIRAVTRALHQNLLLDWQRKQARWKREMPAGALLGLTTQDGGLHEAECPHAPDAEILAGLREHALAGAYCLVDWRGYRGYQPGRERRAAVRHGRARARGSAGGETTARPRCLLPT